MLKQRVITALVLVAVVLSTLFFLPPLYFSVLMAVVCLFAAQECAQLQNWSKQLSWMCAVAVSVVALLAMQLITPEAALWLARLAAVSWIGLVVWLIWLERGSLPGSPQRWTALTVFSLLIVVCVLDVLVQANSSWLLLYVLAIAWAADIGAYFAGRRFGRHKLAPTLSPGKSVEGLVGGLVCVVLLSLAVMPFFEIAQQQPVTWVVASVLAAVFSVAGDLFESTLKRAAKVKDSGWVLPGHGGVLDRIDSLLASVPVFIALCPAVLV